MYHPENIQEINDAFELIKNVEWALEKIDSNSKKDKRILEDLKKDAWEIIKRHANNKEFFEKNFRPHISKKN